MHEEEEFIDEVEIHSLVPSVPDDQQTQFSLPNDSDEEEEEGDGQLDAKDEDFIFVQVLKKHGKVLLEKSQTPAIRSKKKVAEENVNRELAKFGVLYTDLQTKKKIENIKGRLKKKLDSKKTGNIPVNLKPHERLLADLLDYTDNPSISRLRCKFFFP